LGLAFSKRPSGVYFQNSDISQRWIKRRAIVVTVQAKFGSFDNSVDGSHSDSKHLVFDDGGDITSVRGEGDAVKYDAISVSP
jgi:hypothetical protein